MNQPPDMLPALFRNMFRKELTEVVHRAVQDVLPRVLAEMRWADEGLLSVTHAAEYLDVNPKTMRRRIRSGQLKSYGKGSLTRIRKRDLLCVLDSEGAEIIDLDTLADRIVNKE